MEMILAITFFSGMLRAQTITTPVTNFDVSSAKKTDVVIVPLKLSGIAMANIVLKSTQPDDVSNGSISRGQFREAIKIEPDTLSGQPEDALKVTVQLDKLDVQGVYTVSFRYHDNRQPANVFNQLSFNLSRPGAALQCLNTLTVTETGNTIDSSKLVLMETTNRAGIDNLVISPPFIDVPETGDLVTFDKSPYHIDAGKTVKIRLHIHADSFDKLPYGKSNGTLVINSPLLSQPLSVGFVIWKKHGKWLLVLTIVLGLLMGLLIRQFVQKQQGIEQAKLAGYQLIQQMISETQPVNDVNYKKQVTLLISNVQSVVGANKNIIRADAAGMMSAIGQFSAQYVAGKITFEQFMTAQNTAYQVMVAAIVRSDLQPTLQNLLQEAKQTLLKVKTDLESFDPSMAATNLGNTATLLTTMLALYTTYMTSLVTFLSTAGLYPTGITAPAGLANATNPITTALTNAGSSVPMGWSLVLNQLVLAQKFGEALPDFFYADVLNQYTTMDNQKATDPAFLNALHLWASGFGVMAVNAQEQTNAANYWNPQLAAHVAAAWAATGTKTHAALFNLQTAVLLTAPSHAVARVISAPPDPDYYFKQNSLGGQQVLLAAAKVRKWYNWYNVLQFILLFLLLVLAGYKAFGDAFVGTWMQLIGIFLVSFSFDITASNVALLRAATY